jgi:hypothetical protein
MANIMVKTEISYCPDLDQYHYVRGNRPAEGQAPAEGEVFEEYYFDTARLEKVIESYGVTGDQKSAQTMAFLTGLGRRYPHKVLTINPDGTVEVVASKADTTPAEV